MSEKIKICVVNYDDERAAEAIKKRLDVMAQPEIFPMDKPTVRSHWLKQHGVKVTRSWWGPYVVESDEFHYFGKGNSEDAALMEFARFNCLKLWEGAPCNE